MRNTRLLSLLIWLGIALLLLVPPLLLGPGEEAPSWVGVLTSLLMLAFAVFVIAGFLLLLRERNKK